MSVLAWPWGGAGLLCLVFMNAQSLGRALGLASFGRRAVRGGGKPSGFAWVGPSRLCWLTGLRAGCLAGSLLPFRREVVILTRLHLPAVCTTAPSPGWGRWRLDKCARTELWHPRPGAVLPGELLCAVLFRHFPLPNWSCWGLCVSSSRARSDVTATVTCLWSSLFSLKEDQTKDYLVLASHRKACAGVCVHPWWHMLRGDTIRALPFAWSWKGANLEWPLLGGSSNPVLFPCALQPMSTNTRGVRTPSAGQHLFGLQGGFCCFLKAGMPPARSPPLAQLHLAVPAPAATA